MWACTGHIDGLTCDFKESGRRHLTLKPCPKKRRIRGYAGTLESRLNVRVRSWIPWSLVVLLTALAVTSAVVGARTDRGVVLRRGLISPFYAPAEALKTVPISAPLQAGYRGAEDFCAIAPLTGTIHYDGTSRGLSGVLAVEVGGLPPHEDVLVNWSNNFVRAPVIAYFKTNSNRRGHSIVRGGWPSWLGEGRGDRSLDCDGPESFLRPYSNPAEPGVTCPRSTSLRTPQGWPRSPNLGAPCGTFGTARGRRKSHRTPRSESGEGRGIVQPPSRCARRFPRPRLLRNSPRPLRLCDLRNFEMS